ncbi:MAG: ribosome maturation factor RimP [Lachnospiraceae bacterium]|nr:ribosome maturation factor RimP [Lachnospiraceae bacterium]
MSKKEAYEQRTETLAMPILEAHQCSFVDVEYVKEGSEYYLRLYIDKEGGVMITDCEAVSRALSEALDKEDFIPEAYILEVSSPGLGRQIKKPRDFERNLGKEVEIRLFKAAGGKKEYVGTLKSYSDDMITLTENNNDTEIERKNIALIREYVNWDEF